VGKAGGSGTAAMLMNSAAAMVSNSRR